MPDTLTAQPAAPTTTASSPSKITRGSINRGYLDELQSARKVAAAALDSAHAASLAAVECDPTLASGIETLADEIETALGQLTGTRAAKKTATVEEASAREALLAVLQPIQTAAKRAFADDQATLREAYGIGRGLSGETLASVLTLARGVLNRISPGEGGTPPIDKLPGITGRDKITKLATAITTYGAKDNAQDEQKTEAAATLEQIEADITKLAGLRRQVQLAADQAWPWRTPGVITIRKSFLLPPTRPLNE